jgi:NodT family efflux transporter outer membrane factor (OMF) lipoprotein
VAVSSPIRSRHVVVALPLALLGACASVGPNYQRPAAPWSPISWLTGHPAPKPAPKQPPPSLPTEAPVDPAWWALFHDDELTALAGRVAAANLDVQVAGLLPTAEATAAASRQQLSKQGVLSLAGSGTATVPSPNAGGAAVAQNIGIFQPFNLFQTGFDASWEIDFWGHARRQIESAEASAIAAREAQRDVLLRALAELARDYVQLRGVQRDIEITGRNLESAEKSWKLTQERAAGGLTTDLDVANAAALVASISAELPTLEANRDDLIDAIALLLGEPPQSLTGELAAAKPIPPVPPRVPVGLPSDLARRRPDIREAEANLHAATADVGVAVADFYPRVTLTGSVALQATQLHELGNWGSANTWSFGPSLSLPIFEGGRLRRTLELRKQQQQQAAIEYRRAVLTALHEIDTALTDYAAQQRRRELLRAAVEQNGRALSLAQDRYTEGVADFLNVLDAQRNLLAAETQFTDSTTTVATDLVQLYKALGGGWEVALPDTAEPPEPPFTIDNVLE